MNLNTLVSAASWLYAHSPAAEITRESNAIAVAGEGELADALFDLLFTTSFKPDATIELVRVCADADAFGMAFLSRNGEALEHFARNPTSDEGLNRKLSIHFMDSTSLWQEAFRYAWVVLPEDVECPEPAGYVARLGEIPCLSSEGTGWSAADEARVPVLRIARRVHAAYTLAWNDRYLEADIDRALYGSADGYALRSSLRLAVSIPWKLAIAGAADAAELYDALAEADPALDGHTVRAYLAWQEHRSWQAFMTLEGWRMPTEAELAEYLFRDGNDHRCKARRLHPCLCDLAEDDWFDPYPKSLARTAHSGWSRAYVENQEQYPRLDRISLIVHHCCKEIVLSEEYRTGMEARFQRLEEALFASHPRRADLHFPELRLIENLFMRLMNNESNSFHPFEQACAAFLGGVREDLGERGQAVEQAFGDMWRAAGTAVERNKYCDYRGIDARIIDWLPWIISDTAVDTLWKLYAEEDYFENIASALMLRPKRLVFVCQRDPVPPEQLAIYADILAQRGLPDILDAPVLLPDFDLAAMDGNTLARQAVDVGGAGDLQHSVVIPPQVRVVFYENGHLYDKKGAPACARYCDRRIAISVEEMLRLKGQTVLSAFYDNDVLGMEEDYAEFWSFARNQKNLQRWAGTVAVLQDAEQRLRRPIYRDTGTGGQRFSHPLNAEGYRRLIANGGMRALYDLERRRAVSELSIDIDGQQVGMQIFPDQTADGGDPYEESRRTLETILTGSAQSRFAVDTDYARIMDPVHVADLSRPIVPNRADRGKLAALLQKGYLRSAQGREGYTYKSQAIRHCLYKEGFALEAYVYYVLFLSGRFDDVRSNVELQTGVASNGMPLQDELDVLVTASGVMGVISCKDTPNVDAGHIGKLIMQAREYGTVARPILVCARSADLPQEIRSMCQYLKVRLIGMEGLVPKAESRARLIRGVMEALSGDD